MGSQQRFYSNERRLRWNPELVNDNTTRTRGAASKSWGARKSPAAVADGNNGGVNKNKPPYSVGLWSLHPTNNIRGIILRNQQPIQSVRPFGVYQTHKDAMRSLRSLEKKPAPRKTVTNIDAMEKQDTTKKPMKENSEEERTVDDHTVSIRGPSGSMTAKRINPRRHMTELRFAVERLSGFVGKKRSGVFQTTVEEVCHVINSVFDERTDIRLPFRLHRLQYNGFYEIHGIRTIEMYMLPSTIVSTSLEVVYNQRNPMFADVVVHGQIPGMDNFCVKNKTTNIKRLSPCKLMIFLTHFLETTIKKRYDRKGRVKNGKTPTPHGAFIFNTSTNETDASLRIKFPSDTYSYEITLTLALDFNHSFPTTPMSAEHREWPSDDILTAVREQGVHLLAKNNGSHDVHSWTVSFLKARRKLLQLTDETTNKLRLLLALQALRETQLSRPKLLLPVHLTTVVFWASVKYPSSEDWRDDLLAHRFLDVATALRRCMLRGVLWDFFAPSLNHFDGQSREALLELAEKIKQVVVEPLRYA